MHYEDYLFFYDFSFVKRSDYYMNYYIFVCKIGALFYKKICQDTFMTSVGKFLLSHCCFFVIFGALRISTLLDMAPQIAAKYNNVHQNFHPQRMRHILVLMIP